MLEYEASGCGADGSVLEWGSRGPRFDSEHSDQKKDPAVNVSNVPQGLCFFHYYLRDNEISEQKNRPRVHYFHYYLRDNELSEQKNRPRV